MDWLARGSWFIKNKNKIKEVKITTNEMKLRKQAIEAEMDNGDMTNFDEWKINLLVKQSIEKGNFILLDCKQPTKNTRVKTFVVSQEQIKNVDFTDNVYVMLKSESKVLPYVYKVRSKMDSNEIDSIKNKISCLSILTCSLEGGVKEMEEAIDEI